MTRERDEARRLRAEAWTLQEIADHLGVAKSSVSVWVRDVDFVPRPRRVAQRAPNVLQRRKQAEIEDLLAEGVQRIGRLSERDFLIAGIALYAGEGDKTDGRVGFANTEARFVRLFCDWLRYFFEVDESRMRVSLYLHPGARPRCGRDVLVGRDGTSRLISSASPTVEGWSASASGRKM